MKLTFLGTGCSTPTKDRALSGIILEFEGQNFLFDAGEGTQQRIMQAGISYMKIQNIFISHFHADHFLGLPGLIATMSMYERTTPLTVFGPKGIKERLGKALELALMKPSFEIESKELKKGIALKGKNFEVISFPVEHSSQCFGFSFKEKNKEGEFNRKKAEELGIPAGPLYAKLQKGETVEWKGKKFSPEQVMDYSKGRIGRKASIIVDSRPSEKFIEFIQNSDVLVHEGAFSDKEKERAEKTKHSTALEAGIAARKSNAKKLVLTHFSSRYRNTDELVNEAEKEFSNVIAAKDLMELKVEHAKA